MSASRRDLLLGGAMLAAAAAGGLLTPRRRAAMAAGRSLASLVPERIGAWRQGPADGIVRPPEEANSYGPYDRELARSYAAPAGQVMLVIAYGATQSDGVQVHRPEFCYPANGFRLGPLRTATLPFPGGRSIPAAFFTAQQGSRIEHVLYWVRIGDAFPRDGWGQHRALLSSSLRGIIPDGVLVRLSTLGPDPVAAEALLRGFADALFRAVPAQGLRLLAG